jgi:hypothetical protein
VEVSPDYRYVRECVAGRPLGPVLEGKAIFSALVRQGVRACTVCSKMYSRRLALEVVEAARPMPIRNGREDVVYNLLFFLHARKYMANPRTGYGWRVEHKDQAKAWRRQSETGLCFCPGRVRRDCERFAEKSDRNIPTRHRRLHNSASACGKHQGRGRSKVSVSRQIWGFSFR